MTLPKPSKKPLLFLGIIVLMAAGYGLYWFESYKSPSDITDELTAQNIGSTADDFIGVIKASDTANIDRFIALGMNAGTAGQDATPALIVAINTGNANVVTQLLNTLPADNPTEAKRILNLQESTGKTALIVAIEHNDEALMNKLIALGADVSIANSNQETPLIISIKNKLLNLVPPLIEADSKQHASASSINTPDKTASTALLYAIRQQNEKLVALLIQAKADAVSSDPSGATPLMLASEAGNIAIAKLLIAAGAKTDIADRAGNTPISIAIHSAHPDFVKFLIENGADVDFHTTGKLPLELAIETEPFDSNFVKYLLSKSKQLNAVSTELIFKAVDNKDMELVKYLLANGTSPKVLNNNNETLLYHALESGDEDIALLLMDSGVNTAETGIAGISLLERAVKHNEAQVVKRLLSMGASPNQKTSEGYTVAEMAVYRGYPAVLDALLAKGAIIQKDYGILWSIRDGGGSAVPVLLAYGAKPNVMSDAGNPALWLAAAAGDNDAVQALIKYKADINHPDKGQGITPLEIASHSGQLGAVKLLVEAGASLEIKDNYGLTALAHAAYMTKPDVVEYLISKGADIHARDNQNRSIIDLAGSATPSEGRDKIIAMLQNSK